MASKFWVVELDRYKLQDLANIRYNEAKMLLDNGMYDGAYYLSGYVIEHALKACIARRTKEFSFPDKKTVNASYTHELSELVKTAELEQILEADKKKDPQLGSYWEIVDDWSPETRYIRVAQNYAEGLFNAISDKDSGVFTWIKQHW
jgi:HEPN domain-containing protein